MAQSQLKTHDVSDIDDIYACLFSCTEQLYCVGPLLGLLGNLLGNRSRGAESFFVIGLLLVFRVVAQNLFISQVRVDDDDVDYRRFDLEYYLFGRTLHIMMYRVGKRFLAGELFFLTVLGGFLVLFPGLFMFGDVVTVIVCWREWPVIVPDVAARLALT